MRLRKNSFPSLLLFLLLLASHGSLAQQEGYRYKRSIKGAREGWHSIPLPEPVFERLNPDLTDLRIWGITADEDTLEMPYLLRSTAGSSSVQEVPFRLINQSSNSRGYFYTLELLEETDLNEIGLQFGNRNFDWRVNLEGSHTQKEWFGVLEDYRILAIRNQHTQYSFTSLRFPTVRYQYLRLQIISPEKPEMMPPLLLKTTAETGDYQTYHSNFGQQQNKQERQTLVAIQLPGILPVNRVALRLQDTVDYYRPFSIQYPADSTKTSSGWQYHYRTLYAGTLSSLEAPVFSFPATLTNKLRLVIQNGQNLPLSVAEAVVEGPRYSLTARLGAAEHYLLVYGNPQATTPHYDIARFEDKIPGDLDTLALAEESLITEDLPAKSPLFANKLWLWALMLILIVLMGWFTLKMLRTTPNSPDV